ncbi:MAG: cbb3-type cytochrome c oxidase subunit II [Chthoniobacterales bacterium]
MNRLRSLFFIITFLFLSSWLGVVLYSYLQLGHLKSISTSDGLLPPQYSGQAILGAQVYAASGCMTCHTQQVRQIDVTSADIERKWGKRPSVALDYLRDRTAFLGNNRIGPDLSNVGLRLTDPTWHYQHLYEPTVMVSGSIMPSYRYLFRLQKIEGEPSAEAVALTGPHAPPQGYEVVPTQEAKNLVAYLLSLKHDYDPALQDQAAEKSK